MLTAAAVAAQPRTPIDVSRLELQVGDQVPDFTLRDQNGMVRSLQSIMKPFRLVRDVVVEGTLQAQAALRAQAALTISGALEYQACDDKVCFNPVALPVSWTFSIRPLVTARPR